MSSISSSATDASGSLNRSPSDAFTAVLSATVGFTAAKLEQKIGEWAHKLQGVAGATDSSGGLAQLADAGLDGLAEGGAAQKAAAEGAKARLHGKNPVWAAIRGSWQSGTPLVRAAIVTAAAAAIVLLLLSPVLCVVFLLSLLVIAAVHRAHAASS
jgi:hypothetical protein